MNTFVQFQTPDPSAYDTRHASRYDLGHPCHQTFGRALQRVAEAALNVETNGVPADLVDYLAARVEGHNVGSRMSLADLMRDALDADDLNAMHLRMKTVEDEAARTVVVALGIDANTLPPIDFPTLSRYWLACRNAYRPENGREVKA